MKSAVFSLAVFYILLLGCSDDNNITSPTVQTQEIVPLSIGNSWTYQYTIYDTSGGIIYTSIDSFSVIADTVINGKKRFILSTGVMRWNNDFGFWIPMSPDSLLLYKYPANVGDEYSNGLKVICKDSTFVLPSGTFKCYGYSSPVAIDYVSPSVGLVREVWYKKSPSGLEYLYKRQELLSFQVN